MHAKFQVNRQLISETKEGGSIQPPPPPPGREGVEKYHQRERGLIYCWRDVLRNNLHVEAKQTNSILKQPELSLEKHNVNLR